MEPVTERRDPSRVDPVDSPEEPSVAGEPPPRSWFGHRTASLVLAGSLPMLDRRWATRVMIVAVALAVLLAVGYRSFRLATAWLHDQPQHRLPFSEIELDPNPPSYIKLGRVGLLEQVRQRANLPESLAVLEVDLGKLARAFAVYSPWVEQVDGIRRDYPNRLVVQLTYRRPVAFLLEGSPEPIVLDRHGVVLPLKEIDPGTLLELIKIVNVAGPFEPSPGKMLAPAGSDTEVKLRAATELAWFFQRNTPDRLPSLSPVRVTQVNLKFGEKSLYARTAAGLWVLWGDAPGHEPPGSPGATRKWEFLQDWVARHPPPYDPGDYLVFTRERALLNSRRTVRD